MLGPATNENARLPASNEFAETYSSRGTIETNSDAYDTWKSTDSDPTRKATTYSCSIVSTSRPYASGIVAIAAARPRSVAIIVCRLRPRRSTHAPACNANSKFGISSAAIR